MSKMKMPEMSVVRFNESDVIVASIVVRFDNYANSGASGKNDGTITIGGVKYNRNSQVYGVDIFQNLGYTYIPGSPMGPNIEIGGESHSDVTALSTIIDNDHSGTASGVVDGVYQWNGSAFIYIKQ